MIHLACHGDFHPDNPLFSGLALQDGWLTTLEIFNWRLSASLVTLSACQTGRGVVGGGDDLAGLMRAFLSAGARTLVLSQWAVADQATALLMRNFYRALASGEEKPSALRRAMLDLLHGDPLNQHPYFWAPFFLVGDGGRL
jgi:CHAT domain-containing protein